jgi:uncharacterized protein (TIGR02687 family)
LSEELFHAVNNKILDALEKRFQALDCSSRTFRLVFWEDESESFQSSLPAYAEAAKARGWELLELKNSPPLALKHNLLASPNKKLVLYSTGSAPNPNRDPYFDLRLAAPIFSADQWSLYLDEMGLGGRPDLAAHVKLRSRYFKNGSNRTAVAQLGLDPLKETEESLDHKVMAVLSHAEEVSLNAILLGLLRTAEPEEVVTDTLATYGLEPLFWSQIQAAFGFNDPSPTFSKLILRLLTSDLTYTLGTVPSLLKSHVLANQGASFRFCQKWRNDYMSREAYLRWSVWTQESLAVILTGIFDALPLEQLGKVVTFPVEKQILIGYKGKLRPNASKSDLQLVLDGSILRSGQEFWITGNKAEQYKLAYKTCRHAAQFLLDLQSFNPDGLQTATQMTDAYTQTWYRIDQSYRLFCEAVEPLPWDLFKDLADTINGLYVDDYLQRLGLAWSPKVSDSDGEVLPWSGGEVTKQQHFHRKHIEPFLQASPNRRAFVIISDALRYEVAQEVFQQLSVSSRWKPQLGWMYTGLPSITKFGMASLLPHKAILVPSPDTVMADGKTSQGLDNRKKILSAYGGTAIEAQDLMNMKREVGRTFVKEFNTIYIYHDTIDALGDKQATEEQTFQACRQAVDDLMKLVAYIANTLNGAFITITADHGFLYANGENSTVYKSSLPPDIGGSMESKKRYILGKRMDTYPATLHGKLSNYSIESDLEFLIPQGIQRFHFVGGAMFYHGGIMPQEVIVPLLTVRMEQDPSKAEATRKKVEVGIVNFPQTITTRFVQLKVFQSDPVGGDVLPRTLKAGVYDGSVAVTNEVKLLFNSMETDSKALTQALQLHLVGEKFDSKREYRFVLSDSDTDVEVFGQPVRISLMILDEF